MKTIAITSTAGGAGRTTLAAALAVLLARRGRPVVAVEFDPQNLMGALLGLDTLADAGLAQSLLGGAEPWHAHTWRNADGVLFVPYGPVDAAGAAACDARLAADPAWLARALDEIALPAGGVVLIDTARQPSQQAEQALRCADLTLVVVPPEPAACATLAARLDALRAGGRAWQIVVNRLNPARDMQRDALAMLRAAAGPTALLEQRIHADAAVPEAFARGSWIFDDAPYSQTSHDLHGVANWVDAWLTAAVAGRAGAAQ
ncbi:TPA: cellulose synthase operon protein YhjQ [Burkholderia multivorans]|uniref:cellulose biosynthesis protein BcsQ n=1 Tax=Burkholderia multivorans TaxID=87883 RepID=UPI001C232DCB|nr:cellulose biosynthesis protein BcsQ [Burkholderia multivorans]MBU9354639.1 cellulose synthase operon protein YhjQ [Burkholderia multivorans]MBU9397837.1 cellulose synthase operon protein YhjQ [Burkholderia multivorans]HDR9838560.1 cellulose synthase operon protein YhjQ [Burkholderia multivorans]HDR9845475.1 cellulose synthase operon protein YhjQ [Burkholderia multivorans]HDR9851524.1 cellulose synthase operon protein YhjQ [Burkholderia multivorans]